MTITMTTTTIIIIIIAKLINHFTCQVLKIFSSSRSYAFLVKTFYVAGGYGLSPLDSARALAKALSAFTQTSPKLRRVTVVLIDESMVRAFTDILRGVDAQATSQLPNIHEDVSKKSTLQKILGERIVYSLLGD